MKNIFVRLTKKTRKIEFASAVLTGAILSTIVNQFVFSFSSLKGNSMFPTLKNDQKVLILKLGNLFVRKGNIVVAESPNKNKELLLAKRLTAIEGDEVFFHDKRLKIPKGQVWIEGDNKDVSYDSRIFGPIFKSKLKGKIVAIIYPLDEVKLL